MSNLTQNFVNPNNQPLVIGDFSIRQDQDGRYCLNDLHKASGYDKKHQPAYFVRNQQTKDLIAEIENPSSGASANSQRPAIGKVNDGKNNGTYVVKELVYSYAMWISAKFHLMVIRAYDSLAMEWMVGGKQTISPEQAGVLYNIVHTRAGENKNLIMQMWSRLKNHFKYTASYRELRAVHFDDAKHYLEMMELKTKPEKQEVKPQLAMNAYDDKDVQYIMWYAPMLAKLVFDEIVPALRALESHKVGSLFAYTQEMIVHVNTLNRKAKESGLTNLLHVENRLLR